MFDSIFSHSKIDVKESYIDTTSKEFNITFTSIQSISSKILNLYNKNIIVGNYLVDNQKTHTQNFHISDLLYSQSCDFYLCLLC